MFGQADLVPDREEREGRLGANWPSPHLITSGVRKRTFVTQSVPTTVILLDSLSLEILNNYICNMVVSVLGLFCWKKSVLELPGGPVVRAPPFHCWFTPSQGTKSGHAAAKGQASTQRGRQSILIVKWQYFPKSQPEGVRTHLTNTAIYRGLAWYTRILRKRTGGTIFNLFSKYFNSVIFIAIKWLDGRVTVWAYITDLYLCSKITAKYNKLFWKT